jgi:hypothetical protein
MNSSSSDVVFSPDAELKKGWFGGIFNGVVGVVDGWHSKSTKSSPWGKD